MRVAQRRHQLHEPTAVPRYHFLDSFLRVMFPSGDLTPPARPLAAEPEPAFHTLPVLRLKADARFYLPDATMGTPVRMHSPAIEVMTDLRRVAAITIGRLVSVHEANHLMIKRGVRALFVVDDRNRIAGIVTATDVLGGKPVQVTQERGIHHDEVLVRDIMTSVERLEVIDLNDVLNARVGDVMATLRACGRQHALVIEQDKNAGSGPLVRGIFSLSQIARQLGTPSPTPVAGHTFAEMAQAAKT